MRGPNTTVAVYVAPNVPPASPDSIVEGHLADAFQQGQRRTGTFRTFVWCAVLEVPLAADVRDDYPSAPAQTVYVPDSSGQAYEVVFVERVRPAGGDSFKRVYLNRVVIMPGIEIKEADGTPDYTGVTLLVVDQADGFVLSQPAANQARLDLAAASGSQAGIVVLVDQVLGAGLKTVDAAALARSSGASNALDASLRGVSLTDRAGVVLCHRDTSGAPASYKECHVQFRGGLTYWTPFLGAFGMSSVVPSALYGTDNLGWLATCPSSNRWLVARYAATLTNNHAVYLEFNTGASYTTPSKAETNARCDLAADLNLGGYALVGGDLDVRGSCYLGDAAADVIAFFGGTGSAQPSAVADVSGTAGASYGATEQTMINDLKAAVNDLLGKLRTLGLIAT